VVDTTAAAPASGWPLGLGLHRPSAGSYYEGLTLAEIGQVLGVTESRVLMMHASAVLKLRGSSRARSGEMHAGEWQPVGSDAALAVMPSTLGRSSPAMRCGDP